MRRKSQYLAAAMAITLPATAQAQEASFGLDGFVGMAQDDSTATGPDDSTSFGALPSIAFGDQFVVQVDGMVADHRDNGVYGGAAHIGAHVGEGGYIGAYASRSENDRHSGLALYRLGGEAEFDLGAVEFAGVAGYEDSDGGSFLTGTTTTHNIFDVYDGGGEFFAFTDLRYRPSENFRLSVGHRYTGGQHAAAAGISVGFGSNLAVFAEGRLGEGDYNGGFVGLRARFGGGEGGPSLLDNRLIEDLFTAANTRETLAVPLPPPDDEGCGNCGGYGCET